MPVTICSKCGEIANAEWKVRNYSPDLVCGNLFKYFTVGFRSINNVIVLVQLPCGSPVRLCSPCNIVFRRILQQRNLLPPGIVAEPAPSIVTLDLSQPTNNHQVSRSVTTSPKTPFGFASQQSEGGFALSEHSPVHAPHSPSARRDRHVPHLKTPRNVSKKEAVPLYKVKLCACNACYSGRCKQ